MENIILTRSTIQQYNNFVESFKAATEYLICDRLTIRSEDVVAIGFVGNDNF